MMVSDFLILLYSFLILTQPLAVITLFNSLHSFSKHDWHVMSIRTMRKATTQFSLCSKSMISETFHCRGHPASTTASMAEIKTKEHHHSNSFVSCKNPLKQLEKLRLTSFSYTKLTASIKGI